MSIIRYIVIILLCFLAVFGIVFGALLPFKKAQHFIIALQKARTVRTVEDLKKVFDVPLTYASPVGDEEVAKFLANDILGMIRSQKEDVGRALADYVDPYLLRYSSDVRFMLQRGYIYSELWRRSKKLNDYQRAEESFRLAYQNGPGVPRVLYSLFNLYIESGNKQGIREIGNVILTHWPTDEAVKEVLQKVGQ